jgi:hypothetical protein
MRLTKHQIKKAIAYEKAWSSYLNGTKTSEGTLISSLTGEQIDRLRAIEASPECRAFKEFLRSLSNQEFRELQAVMLIGRGDYQVTEFQRACDEPGLDADRENDVRYVIEKVEANYFANGFEKLTTARII